MKCLKTISGCQQYVVKVADTQENFADTEDTEDTECFVRIPGIPSVQIFIVQVHRDRNILRC